MNAFRVICFMMAWLLVLSAFIVIAQPAHAESTYCNNEGDNTTVCNTFHQDGTTDAVYGTTNEGTTVWTNYGQEVQQANGDTERE